jgi:hypothetical protein
MTSSIISIYIPRMHSNVSETHISDIFFNQAFGSVSCVDFVPIDKRPGFVEYVDNVVKSAFVHFHYFNNNKAVQDILEKLNQCTSHKFYPYDNNNHYWVLLKAKNVVPRTMMNNSQIVENCRYLENKVVVLEEKIESLQSLLYQLVGGLFNQESQSEILNNYINQIYPNQNSVTFNKDKNSKWGFDPTTRQGDECEERLSVIESQLMKVFSPAVFVPFVTKFSKQTETKYNKNLEDLEEFCPYESGSEYFNEKQEINDYLENCKEEEYEYGDECIKEMLKQDMEEYIQSYYEDKTSNHDENDLEFKKDLREHYQYYKNSIKYGL